MIAPGLAFCVAVGFISNWLSVAFLPEIGGPTIAVLIGILVGNTFLSKGRGVAPGVKFSEKRMIELSIVLLGGTLTLEAISELGVRGGVFIVLQMCATLAFVMIFCKRLHFSDAESKLLASGNAVCGSNAIASVAPVVGASIQEKARAIVVTNLMGTVLMLALPLLALRVYGGDALESGALIGGTVQSVGHVIATGAMVSHDVMTWATLFKLMRVLLLVVVVVFMGASTRRQLARQSRAKAVDKVSLGAKRYLVVTRYIPVSIIGFTVLCLFNSAFLFPEVISNALHTLCTWCEITALAAIGMGFNVRDFLKCGKKMLTFASVTLVFQVALAVLLIHLLYATF
jgi:uncharacterized integral membrane protein (TIGR00698 family)